MTEFKSIHFLAEILLVLTIFNTARAMYPDSIHAQCPFIDTVDLTGHKQFKNGSYLYQGFIIPPHLVAEYEYTINGLSVRVPTKPHVRGCVCKVKPCVTFCCPITSKYNGTSCQELDGNSTVSTFMNVISSHGKITELDLTEQFSFQFTMTCSEMYHLLPFENSYDGFSLFENGTLLRWDDKRYLSKDEYCLSTKYLENGTDILVPLNCFETPPGTAKTIVNGCMMLFSTPFMFLTIIVYLAIPELRTLHGKSLCCYLFGLFCGYSILSAFILLPPEYITFSQCTLLGFCAYFSFMASFFWLSVISFDLFYNIRSTRGRNKQKEKKRFLMYSIYSWGLALICLSLTYLAQQSSWMPDSLKPGIGSPETCWLNVKTGWSAMIYFYSPILAVITFNVIMFVLTARQIHAVQKEMSRVMQHNDSQKNLRTEKDRFGVFLRLFIVMGVTWSMEIISYLIGQDSAWSKLFYVTDVLNGIQGFLIFALFVLKKKVKQYIVNRYTSISDRKRQSQYSNKTTSSSINIPINSIGPDKPLMDKIGKIQK